MTVRAAASKSYVIPGDYIPATMPDPIANKGMFAWDDTYKCYMQSDGTIWKPTSITANVTSYTGTSDASGNWTVTFPVAKLTIPHVNPQLYPPTNSFMICRLTSVSLTGFTVKIETRTTLNVVGIDLLSSAATNLASQPIRALVVD